LIPVIFAESNIVFIKRAAYAALFMNNYNSLLTLTIVFVIMFTKVACTFVRSR